MKTTALSLNPQKEWHIMKQHTHTLVPAALAVAIIASLTCLTACNKRDAQADLDKAARQRAGEAARQLQQARMLRLRDSTPPWTSSQVAAADSVEGQLRSQGKHWVKTPGEITVGAYVQDRLEGRLDQPKGRGAIGKVISISTGEDGPKAATVDFGRGYSPGINLSELSLVSVASE